MRILGEEIPLKANLQASFQRYRLLWIILLVTASLDYLTTLYFMWQD